MFLDVPENIFFCCTCTCSSGGCLPYGNFLNSECKMACDVFVIDFFFLDKICTG